MDNFYDELDKLIDSEKSTEELLDEIGLTEKEALSRSEKLVERFRSIADSLGIDLSQKKPRIWYDLFFCYEDNEKRREFLMLMLADCSLFFEKNKEIGSYLCTKAKLDRITAWVDNYRAKKAEFDEIVAIVKSTKKTKLPVFTSSEDSHTAAVMLAGVMLSDIPSCKDILTDNDILISNLESLYLLTQSNENLKRITPLVCCQVMAHNRKKLLTSEGYIANEKNMFNYEEYNIADDNGKNFNQYAEYCSLYLDLKDKCSFDADLKLCDVGFTSCSNLAEWCFENCERIEDMPITPYHFVVECAPLAFENGWEDIDFWRNNGISQEEIEAWKTKYTVLSQKICRAVRRADFKDIVEYTENTEQYLQRILELSNLLDNIKPEQLHILRALTVHKLQIHFEEQLEVILSDLLQ